MAGSRLERGEALRPLPLLAAQYPRHAVLALYLTRLAPARSARAPWRHSNHRFLTRARRGRNRYTQW
jgi:hypothetical protein